jgi:hypothetical protein
MPSAIISRGKAGGISHYERIALLEMVRAGTHVVTLTLRIVRGHAVRRVETMVDIDIANSDCDTVTRVDASKGPRWVHSPSQLSQRPRL